MKYNKLAYALMTALIALALAGCGGEQSKESGDPSPTSGQTEKGQTPVAPQPPKPVTLQFLNSQQDVPWAEMAKTWTEKKFPHITLVITQSTNKAEEQLGGLLAAGKRFDLVYSPLGGLYDNLNLGAYTDLTPLMKKHQFDSGQFSPGVLETLQSYGENGTIPVFPFVLNSHALFYNKTLFQRFGVPYPTDGMNWDQLNDLARRMTRVDDGKQYKGFHMNGLNIVYKNQMGLPFVDYAKNKAAVNTDSWKRWMDLHAGLYKISGNESSGVETLQFMTEQILAMRVGPNLFTATTAALQTAVEGGFDFDLATYPQIAGVPSHNQMNSPILGIMPNSEHQDEAFQVLTYWLSDEVQTLRSRAGFIPVVRSEQARKAYAADLSFARGKNIEALFKDTIGKPITAGIFDGRARAIANNALTEIMNGTKDTNTALRDAEEEINKYIDDELKK